MATRYLSEDEMRARWSADRVHRLLDKDEDGIPDEGQLTETIERAERHADEVLLTRYELADLPATPATTGHSLKDIVAGIAWYYLHEHLDTIADSVLQIFEAAKSRLWALARNQTSLGLSPAPTSDRVTARVLTSKGSSDRVFTDSELEGW